MRIPGLLKSLFNSSNALGGAKQFEKTSYAQSGEDIIIEYIFRLRQIQAPTCLDIGAYHPIASNNTYKFFLKGSMIVNIDANPSAIEKFVLERPSDVNLNIGIGAHTGELDFFIMDDEALNTFSEEEKVNLEIMGNSVKTIKKINVITINQVFRDYFNDQAPDLISIDAEGVDFDIVKSLDFGKYTPKVICIESINYTRDGTGTKRFSLCRYIEDAGYIEYGNTNINSIFVNKKWWFGESNKPI